MLLYSLLVAVLLSGVVSGAPSLFAAVESPWSDCRAANETQACYRTRDVACVRTSDNKTAPWYYCMDAGRERTSSVELCSKGACVQDCAVTKWNSWSSCNCDSGFYRTRNRTIIVPPRNNGDPCPALLDRELCSSCINNALFDSRPRRYTWRTDKWGVCSALNAKCGSGIQNRTVECNDSDGSRAPLSMCLNELAYTNLIAPPTSRLCNVPCNCEVSVWGSWSPCRSLCDTTTARTAHVRTRTITQQPTTGGTDCPSLTQSRACSEEHNNTCPSYHWNTSDWSTCQYQTGASCGHGYSTRYIYCVKKHAGTIESVNHTFCDLSSRPVELEICDTPCLHACVLEQWSAWSDCTPSCELAYSNRTRDILVEPQGEAVCLHRLELRQCPQLPCLQWIPDEFSICFVPGDKGCGSGSQSRNVYCADVHGNRLESYLCSRLSSPPRSQTCYIPCPTDCVVSDWTPWNTCSHVCGQDMGTQNRTRQLVAVGINCTYSDDDYMDTRTCTSSTACEEASYHIEVGSWSECGDSPLASGDQPNSVRFNEPSLCDIGVRSRTSRCIHEGNVIPAENCPIQFNSIEKEPCVLSCAVQACVFSPWSDYSECSVPCGLGKMTRSRRLLHYPTNPERECQVDRSGLQLETLECVVNCPMYNWIINNWSDCVLFPSNVPCGLGYETTTYTCTDAMTLEAMDDSLCANIPPPLSARHCAVPCPDRCLLTHWTQYSICKNGRQNRTREIIPFAGSDDWMTSCPELSNLRMEQIVDCTIINLDRYDYSVLGSFSNTIIDDPYAVCGNGYEYRTVACIDMFTVKVHDEEFCGHREIGDDKLSIRPSSIKCNTDCVQSEWSDWSPCSSTCSYGYRTRNRTIETHPLPGGRPCGNHQEMDICYTVPCRYAQYIPGAYTTCRVSNTTTLCGLGVRTREPLCVVNGVQQDTSMECDEVAVNFELSEPCDMPCPGECVMSEWSEWGVCPTDCPPGACQHERTRRILREGIDNMDNCLMTQEFRHCDAEVYPYAWSVRVWGDCTLGPVDVDLNPGAYCGDGVQRGMVVCANTLTGEAVFDGLCEGLKPMDILNCTIPCPVDCIVDLFSDWTPCLEQCELTPAMQNRRRDVSVPSMFGGRSCPDLIQTRSCSPVNCTEYVLESSEADYTCDLDLTLQAQCGSAAISKPISCRRNTQYMDLSVCLEAIEQGLPVRGSQLTVDVNCTEKCPIVAMCTYTDWTEWSNCTSLCVDGNVWFQFRSRALISSHSGSEQECESMQYDINECPMLEPVPRNSTDLIPFNLSENCINIQWQTSEFDFTGVRSVECITENGQSLSSGCPLETKPSSTLLSCNQVTCPVYSDCVGGGACECVPELEAVGALCLPLRGCKDDSHCLYASTVCLEGQCVCRDNFVTMDGRCVYIGPLTTTMATDVETTGSMTTGDVVKSPVTTTQDHTTHTSTNSTLPPTPTETAPLGILPIVLIATIPLVIIILVIITIIAIMYRCHKKLEGSHKVNSLKRRREIEISAPSPVHSLDRYHRGADSASSGFVDDVEHDHFKYGMSGKSFLSSRKMIPSSREDIDEAAFNAEFPAQVPPSPHPIPVAVPMLPGYQLQHIGLEYSPRDAPTEIPDGDFTTDIYTTDDGSLVTTSVPPSSAGSPNFARRHAHQQQQFTSHSQETYIPMQPIYSQVTPRSQRLQESHEWEGEDGTPHHHGYFERNGSPNRSVQSYGHRSLPTDHSRVRDHVGNRERLQSNSSYDYREYRGGPPQDHRGPPQDHRGLDTRGPPQDHRGLDTRGPPQDHRGTPLDTRGRSQSAGKDYKRYEHQRERYYSTGRQDYRSPSPNSGPTRQNHAPRSIATGLDNSLVQAIAQMSGREGSITPSHSVQSGGSRSSHRRRRRRYQGQPHHMTSNSRYRYGSDGPSDQDLTSASEAEQNYERRMPSRSLPISPAPLTDPDEPDYDTLPPPHIKLSPATPPTNRATPTNRVTPINTIRSPDHTPQNRVALLRSSQRAQTGHYDYPRCFQQSPDRAVATSTHSQPPTRVPPPPPTRVPPPLPTHVSPPTSPLSQTAQAPVTTRYEHLVPLKLTPVVEGSPLPGRRHPPSPLVLHSEGVVTPRSSGEVTTFHPPQESTNGQ